MTPFYLYKILSVDDWQASQLSTSVQLSAADNDFIHLSKEDQLDRIINKYWIDQEFIILKLETSKLQGQLVLEANPGGTTQYYHLYQGSIPLDAVVESKRIRNSKR